MTTRQLLTETETLFLPRDVWEELLQDATEDLSAIERQLTHWIIFELHNRHVGVPVEMAVKTAQLLASHSQNTPEPWDLISSRLSETLQELNNMPQISNRLLSHGILLHTVPRFVVLDLLLPIVTHACCEKVHRNILFCANRFDDWFPNPSQRKQQRGIWPFNRPNILEDYREIYSHYTRQFSAQGSGEGSEPGLDLLGLGDIFWKDRLYTLFSLSQTVPADDNSPPPEVKRYAAHIFLEQRPDMTERADWSQRSVELAETPFVKSLLLEDAGVDGVTISRDIELANRMLMSEWVNMLLSDDAELDLVWLDRMVNDGYGITERPPYWIQLRDTFIIGMCPNVLRTQQTGLFLKTVWFEFAMRMSRLLQRNKLTLSELRWVEGNQTHGMRSQAMLVEFLPEVSGNIDDGNHAEHVRHRFLKATGWFPSFIDPRERFKPLKELANNSGPGNGVSPLATRATHPTDKPNAHVHDMQKLSDSINAWGYEAWRAQREVAQWAEFKDAYGSYKSRKTYKAPTSLRFGYEKLDLSKFAFHHMMLFLPMSLYRVLNNPTSKDANAQQRSTSYQSWIHRFDQVKNLSITWVPDQFEVKVSDSAEPRTCEWRFSGYQSPDKLVYDGSPVALGELAAELLNTWSHVLIKEMQRE